MMDTINNLVGEYMYLDDTNQGAGHILLTI